MQKCGLVGKCCATRCSRGASLHESTSLSGFIIKVSADPRCGAHFSGRAQERILIGAVAMDARGAGLEGGLRECRSGCLQTRTTGGRREPASNRSSTKEFCGGDAVGLSGRSEFARKFFQSMFKVLSELPCSHEGEVSSGISCGIGGVCTPQSCRTMRRSQSRRGSCSVCCLSGCCSDRVPKVGLAETSWCGRFNLFEEA